MTARMKNPAMVLSGAMPAINALYKAAHSAGVPNTTLELVHLRASQINGCSVCVDRGRAGRDGAGRGGDPPGRPVWIATTNFFNVINAATRQMAPQDW